MSAKSRYQNFDSLLPVTSQLTLLVLALIRLQHNWQRLYRITAVCSPFGLCLPSFLSRDRPHLPNMAFVSYFVHLLLALTQFIEWEIDEMEDDFLYGKHILPLRNKLILGLACIIKHQLQGHWTRALWLKFQIQFHSKLWWGSCQQCILRASFWTYILLEFHFTLIFNKHLLSAYYVQDTFTRVMSFNSVLWVLLSAVDRNRLSDFLRVAQPINWQARTQTFHFKFIIFLLPYS